MKDEFYAHSREGIPPKHRHHLEDHLREVAEVARTFANDFKRRLLGLSGGTDS
jgi:hypothetical protein